MYFDVETSSVADVIAEREGDDEDVFFDDDCLDDLRALASAA